MKVYGYVRKGYPIGTTEQLKLVCQYNCDVVFVEEELLFKDVELRKLLEEIKPNDCLYIASLKVFGKNLQELIILMKLLCEKAIRLICWEDDLDTSKPLSFYEIAQLVAGTEISRQRHQIKKSVVLKRAPLLTSGRPTINDQTIEDIKKYYLKDKYTLREISEKCHVSLGTVHKYVKRTKSKGGTEK